MQRIWLDNLLRRFGNIKTKGFSIQLIIQALKDVLVDCPFLSEAQIEFLLVTFINKLPNYLPIPLSA
jgi:hypothetical protein